MKVPSLFDMVDDFFFGSGQDSPIGCRPAPSPYASAVKQLMKAVNILRSGVQANRNYIIDLWKNVEELNKRVDELEQRREKDNAAKEDNAL